ncbi:low molecular weight phosphatase family protein [Maribacter sp. HTCC2170]|uniref:arsenate-mycothiol transferase ArsC n=1 Tax=Maribacter sp. (strain HTCC2170 / KCCM 42371) TaxID=313603 RepID=UPI00006AFD10|nr:protein-tyrosine-phosphatase [Maribacter sp. HTCC2170]EAR01157.1 probable arsenate reductase [Maribacter sp. HTCC2170]
MNTTEVFKDIKDVIDSLETESIPDERKVVLKPFIEYIQGKVKSKKEIRLNFICTHNSRRSHLSQVWAQALSCHMNIPNVMCYSGGTEATALYPVAAQTLTGLGFKITALSEGSNPVYAIKYAENAHPIIGFSKRFNDEFNPSSGFLAIMTCSEADSGCPFVSGAEQRLPVTFEDPKAFDNTPLQKEKYKERAIQIATELVYVFSQIDLA